MSTDQTKGPLSGLAEYLRSDAQQTLANCDRDPQISERTLKQVGKLTGWADLIEHIEKVATDRLKEGQLVVTKNDQGIIVAVTRQDDEHRILKVVAESEPLKMVAQVKSWTNGSYHRNYQLEWKYDVPEGTVLFAVLPKAKG